MSRALQRGRQLYHASLSTMSHVSVFPYRTRVGHEGFTYVSSPLFPLWWLAFTSNVLIRWNVHKPVMLVDDIFKATKSSISAPFFWCHISVRKARTSVLCRSLRVDQVQDFEWARHPIFQCKIRHFGLND